MPHIFFKVHRIALGIYFFFSFFNFRFSIGLSTAFFCCSLLPLSFFSLITHICFSLFENDLRRKPVRPPWANTRKSKILFFLFLILLSIFILAGTVKPFRVARDQLHKKPTEAFRFSKNALAFCVRLNHVVMQYCLYF